MNLGYIQTFWNSSESAINALLAKVMVLFSENLQNAHFLDLATIL
jgi:hypothetical protein